MTVQRFSMTRTQKLRRALERAAELPNDTDHHGYPLHTAGWFKSPGDPEAIVRASEVLRVKPGYKLVAYQYRAGENGNGVVWALPTSAPFPEPYECEVLEDRFANPPRPADAFDAMDAIEGDASAWSYLAASLLARQFLEYGAIWHGIGWGTHEILCRDPWRAPQRPTSSLREGPHTPREEWQWNERPPEDWRPSVDIGDGSVVVTFFTFSALGAETISRNRDTYTSPSYRPEMDLPTIGEGGGGFVF
jgi:hypothetical protein